VKIKNLVRSASSLRTTAVLFAALLFVLLLRVVLPQESVVGAETVNKLAGKSNIMNLLLKGLGLKDVASSPVFLATAALFFINLTLVLAGFSKAVAARMRFVPSSYSGWRSARMKTGKEEAIAGLERLSFVIKEQEGGAVWGVRNRYSPLGFMLFHLSLFLFLTGGVLLYSTRYVARIDLMKDAAFEYDPATVKILRKPLVFPADNPFIVTLDAVQAEKENGAPVKLKTTLSFLSFGNLRELPAEVNRPASFLGYSFLPLTKDRAFVFTTRDSSGKETAKYFIMSEVESGKDLEGRIGDDCILKIKSGGDKFEISKGDEAHSAEMEPGAEAVVPGVTVTLTGMTDWVSFLVVHEHGQALLIAGFCLAIAGLSIRFLFPRQDVVIDGSRIYFRGEYFPLALRYLLYEIGADDDSF